MLQSSTLAAGDTPLAFVVLVPFLAAYLFVRDGRSRAAVRDRSDPFFDGLIFLFLSLICVILVFFVPARLSWYYWLQRLDLLIVPIFALAVVVLFWGLGGAGLVKRSLIYLVLVWPIPLVWIQQAIAPALTNLTSIFGALAVRVFSLPIAIAANDSSRFVSTGPERFTITISEECSGMNALLGFLIVGLPLALTWTGKNRNKFLWLLTGAVAALLSNFLRVGILLFLSTMTGIDFALGTVHPVLGTVLFAVVFLGMLGLGRTFGLRFNNRNTMSIGECQLGLRPQSYNNRMWLAGAFALVLALGQTTLAQFGPLNAESLPATPVSEAVALLPEIPGWSRETRRDISWQNLFGPDSESRLVQYQSGDASIVVQFVATPDKRLLDTYSLEQCDLFHGETLLGVSTVSLGNGISARLVESQLDRGKKKPLLNTNTLYWFMPIVVGGRPSHARIALLTDTEMLPDSQVKLGSPEANPILQIRDRLDSTFSPYPAAQSRPDFAELDAYTIAFGRKMVEVISERSASARQN